MAATTNEHRVTALEQTLERLERLGGEFQLAAAPEGGGWVRAEEIVHGGTAYRDGLARLAATTGPGVPKRAIASTWMLHYLRYLWPAIAGFALERRVPDAAAGNLLVRLEDDGMPGALALAEPRFAALANDPAASTAAEVLDGEDALVRWALHRLVDENAAPLVQTVRASAGTALPILWGNVAASLALPLFWGAQLASGDTAAALRDLERLAGHPGYPQLRRRIAVRTVRHGGRAWVVHTRRTCCLNRRLPAAELCEDCPVWREPEATRQIEDLFIGALERRPG